MHAQVELNLAMILFLPWFAILAALFWIYPRRGPRPAARNLFDAAALLLATAAGVLATWWSIRHADPQAGAIWKQVLASTLSYGAFLAVMTAAVFLRGRWILAPRSPSETSR
jgi:hypothetical protein